MGIAENIRRIRTKSGLTQEEFGKAVGVSAMAVSQWENGRAVPRMGAVQAISDHFNISKSEIIDEEPRLRETGFEEDRIEAMKLVREIIRESASHNLVDDEPLTKQEMRLIELFRRCNSEWKRYVMQAAKIAVSQTQNDQSYQESKDECEIRDA